MNKLSNLPVGVVIHGHHLAFLDDTVLLGQVLLCEGLLVWVLAWRSIEDDKEIRTVLSLLSPIFLPINWFIQFDVLSSPPLLPMIPGTTRGMLVGCLGGFCLVV